MLLFFFFLTTPKQNFRVFCFFTSVLLKSSQIFFTSASHLRFASTLHFYTSRHHLTLLGGPFLLHRISTSMLLRCASMSSTSHLRLDVFCFATSWTFVSMISLNTRFVASWSIAAGKGRPPDLFHASSPAFVKLIAVIHVFPTPSLCWVFADCPRWFVLLKNPIKNPSSSWSALLLPTGALAALLVSHTIHEFGTQ
jgi:hypothetical protein